MRFLARCLASLLLLAATLHATNPVERLRQRLASGAVRLEYKAPRGYLDSLLEILHISPLTQTLVFSKTSAQFRLISPQSPRALYFNDDVYVGWVRGGPFIEISTADTEAGAAFYVLSQTPNSKPSITKDRGQCLQCHESGRTGLIPGHLTRSLYAAADGQPALRFGSTDVDQTTPLAERFGGWFVTGAPFEHRGNQVLAAGGDHTETAPIDLSGIAAPDNYLRNDSSVLAHLLLGHQTQMHNRIARAALEARAAVAYREEMERALGEVSAETLASVKRRIERPAEEMLEYLFFCGEAPLPAPLDANTPLAKVFSQRGALCQLDLTKRLLRIPLSYLVLSEAFDTLPPETLNYVKFRIRDILNGTDATGRFAHLSKDDRESILRVLRAKKPALITRDAWPAGADSAGSRSSVQLAPSR